MHAQAQEPRSLPLLDLPEGVLQIILSYCDPGGTR
jgi:hypothetical protein